MLSFVGWDGQIGMPIRDSFAMESYSASASLAEYFYREEILRKTATSLQREENHHLHPKQFVSSYLAIAKTQKSKPAGLWP